MATKIKPHVQGQAYLDDYIRASAEEKRTMIPTINDKHNLNSLVLHLTTEYSKALKNLQKILTMRLTKEAKKNKSAVKQRYSLVISVDNSEVDLTSEYLLRLFKNAIKLIFSLTSREKVAVRRKSTFSDKNGNKVFEMDNSLYAAVVRILESRDFNDKVGQFYDADRRVTTIQEMLGNNNSVFSRMINGFVYNQPLKDLINLIMRLSRVKYNSKLTNISDFLDANPEIAELVAAREDLDTNSFSNVLYIVPGAAGSNPYGYSPRQWVSTSKTMVYTYAFNSGDFEVYTRRHGAGFQYKFVRNKVLYHSTQVKAKSYVIKTGASPLQVVDIYMRSSYLSGFGRIVPPRVKFIDIKDKPFVSSIIKDIKDMKSNFSQSKIPNVAKYLAGSRADPGMTVEDFYPTKFTDILDRYPQIDDDVLEFFTRTLQAEEDHDLIIKILSDEGKQVFTDMSR